MKGLQYLVRDSDRQQSGPTSHHAWWERNRTYQRAQSCPLGPITLGDHLWSPHAASNAIAESHSKSSEKEKFHICLSNKVNKVSVRLMKR